MPRAGKLYRVLVHVTMHEAQATFTASSSCCLSCLLRTRMLSPACKLHCTVKLSRIMLFAELHLRPLYLPRIINAIARMGAAQDAPQCGRGIPSQRSDGQGLATVVVLAVLCCSFHADLRLLLHPPAPASMPLNVVVERLCEGGGLGAVSGLADLASILTCRLGHMHACEEAIRPQKPPLTRRNFFSRCCHSEQSDRRTSAASFSVLLSDSERLGRYSYAF
jgi:hypothetical protein